jgi:hypothetical protein
MAFVLSHAQDSHKAPRVAAGPSSPIVIGRDGAVAIMLLSSTSGSSATSKSTIVDALFQCM